MIDRKKDRYSQKKLVKMLYIMQYGMIYRKNGKIMYYLSLYHPKSDDIQKLDNISLAYSPIKGGEKHTLTQKNLASMTGR
jgi:hypothetical protein